MPRTTETAATERRRSGGTASGSRSGGAADGNRLVIVESPAKAKTIAGYLGPGYLVESSIGHIRDLPRNAADVPAARKGESWARLGVDVDHGFEPLYVISADKKSQVAKLRALVKDASALYLATDEDREGEAIAWHLLEVLKPRVPVHRMVFHEITPTAIQAAIDSPRELDLDLVQAQETRRILDRLYGYEVSPVLWKKVLPGLSAGRVQSVATRMVVDRERARMRFVSAGYWDIEGDFAVSTAQEPGAPTRLVARLVSLDGTRLATGSSFTEAGTVKPGADVVVLDEARARALAAALEGAPFEVAGVEERPYRRSPSAPFMTSTLQQEAGRKLRFSAQRTMQIAQRLYENGYITYMRTDSTTLSETALRAARATVLELYGQSYLPDRPRTYARKVKNAQEAHEAIRPSGDTFRTPGELAGQLSADERRLYELIWQRTVASQMADATGTTATVRIRGRAGTGEEAEFTASGRVITFPGFMRAYVEGADDPDAELDDSERRLPAVSTGERLEAGVLRPDGHATTPPPRYTEASLVKALEELGVGRPSTYASIMGTIADRGYVWKKGSALVPSFVAFAVVALLERHFSRLVDYAFTASVEDDLDEIAAGEVESVEWLTRFYFGSDPGAEDGAGLRQLVNERLSEIDAREVNSIPVAVDDGGREIVVRVGRYGPYLQRSRPGAPPEESDRASLPETLAPDELTLARAEELLAAPSGDRVVGRDDQGREILVRTGRYGPYVTVALPEGSKEKAPAASLFASMSPETVTEEDARRLLSLPRTLGTDPDGREVTAQNGRYGPYVKKGTESRSLDSEESLFTVTLEQAEALFAQPKRGRQARAAAAPLRELGPDPETGGAVTVREGRFGPYVTDGTTNASLRKGDTVEEVTLERAAELLAERRAKGPSTRARKAPARKTPARKTTKTAGAAKAAGAGRARAGRTSTSGTAEGG